MSDGYEVWVGPSCITEIERGRNVTIAQTHGEDWSAPPVVRTHAEAMSAYEVPSPEPAPQHLRAISTPAPRYNGFFIFMVILTAICAAALVLALR